MMDIIKKLKDLNPLKHIFNRNKGPNKAAFDAYYNAASRGNMQALQAFIKKYPKQFDDGNEAGVTALMFAAEGGQLQATEFLIVSGANIFKQDNNGLTALHHAMGAGTDEATEVAHYISRILIELKKQELLQKIGQPGPDSP
jgi:ankyrin repeat protein